MATDYMQGVALYNTQDGDGRTKTRHKRVKSWTLTKMPEVVLQATPRVFGDERLNESPRLLLVFHISVNPAQS